MSSTKVDPGQLSKTIADLVDEYGEEVYKNVEAAAKKTAREATSELKQTSPGNFAKKWRHRADKNAGKSYGEIVYNAEPGLTHLLEKEHSTGPKRGGHYPSSGGDKDHTGEIAKVEEKYVEKFFDDLVRGL